MVEIDSNFGRPSRSSLIYLIKILMDSITLLIKFYSGDPRARILCVSQRIKNSWSSHNLGYAPMNLAGNSRFQWEQEMKLIN